MNYRGWLRACGGSDNTGSKTSSSGYLLTSRHFPDKAQLDNFGQVNNCHHIGSLFLNWVALPGLACSWAPVTCRVNVDKGVAWHNENISEFVNTWINYVDQAARSGASGGARAGGGPPVADNLNMLLDSYTLNRQHWHLAGIQVRGLTERLFSICSSWTHWQCGHW